MKRVEVCVALPGCCWACGSSNREWYIDTERSIDYYGAVYICNKCVEGWAAIAGMLSSDIKDAYESKIEHQEGVIFDLTVQVSGLEQAVDGLRTAGSITRSGPHPGNSLLDDSTKQASSVREEPVGLEGGASPESSNDEGLGELHSTQPSTNAEFTLGI